jgi:hypothetical protein
VWPRPWARSRGRGAEDGQRTFRPLTAHKLDRLGLTVGGVAAAAGEPRDPSRWPPPFFYSAARRGPPARVELGRPQSGRRDEVAHRARWDPMGQGDQV